MKIRVSNSLFGDSEWVDAVLNLPIVTGDNLWAGENSRAEVRIGSN